MNTSWTDLAFEVDTKSAETVEALAAQCTNLGIYIEDYSDMERMLPLIGGADYVDEKLAAKDKSHVAVHIYVPSDELPEKVVSRMCELLATAEVKYELRCTSINDDDWSNAWKKYHRPQRVGKRLVICPSWEEYDRTDDDVVLTMDPGSSFGSGRDETTRLCLSLIESNLVAGDSVLDIGCGSGILSVAALLLGAKSAVGVDIERNAVNNAAENARINGVGSCFSGFYGNVLTDSELEKSLGSGYDLICANIVADVHISMRDIFFNKLKRGGSLTLSGIINTRTDEVRSAIQSAGFELKDVKEENGWTALCFDKI